MKTHRVIRVNRQTPCPVCGHTDWCGVSEDGAICVCTRVDEGAIKDFRHGWYVHRLRSDPARPTHEERVSPRRTDLDQLALHFERSLDLQQIMALAGILQSPSSVGKSYLIEEYRSRGPPTKR